MYYVQIFRLNFQHLFTQSFVPGPRKDSATGPKIRDDDILCCGGCGCYGMAGEFLNTEACSSECQSR